MTVMCGYCGRDADAICTVEGCNASICHRHRDEGGVCTGLHTATPEPKPPKAPLLAELQLPEESKPKRRSSRRKKSDA